MADRVPGVRDLPRCREKVYLVQDHEPEFFATSAESIWAEETYRMGYRCIAYTPWMADVLRERYGVEARWFECGTDLDVFPFAGPEGREREIIAVYARRETERRAVDLAIAGLALLAAAPAHDPARAVRVAPTGTALPFHAEDLRVVPPRRLAAAVPRGRRRARLLAHDPLARRARDDGQRAADRWSSRATTSARRSARPASSSSRSPRRPDAIADAIERLLDDREAAAAMAARARRFVEARTWERAGDQVEAAMRDFLSHPRASLHG